MPNLLTRSFFFGPGLAITLLQACGSGTETTPADFMEADEALGAEETPECAIPSLCQLCDDGSCATPHVEIVDGDCGPISYTCEGEPADDGGHAPGVATSSPPNPGHVDGTLPGAAGCPVPAICQLCDDGSCASAHVELVDGECGPISYRCDGTPGGNTASPVNPPATTADCPVPAICQLCDDGTCATPEVEFKDGKCGTVHFVCAANGDASPGADAGAD